MLHKILFRNSSKDVLLNNWLLDKLGIVPSKVSLAKISIYHWSNQQHDLLLCIWIFLAGTYSSLLVSRARALSDLEEKLVLWLIALQRGSITNEYRWPISLCVFQNVLNMLWYFSQMFVYVQIKSFPSEIITLQTRNFNHSLYPLKTLSKLMFMPQVFV